MHAYAMILFGHFAESKIKSVKDNFGHIQLGTKLFANIDDGTKSEKPFTKLKTWSIANNKS